MGDEGNAPATAKVVRPALDYDAVKLLRDHPEDYFESEAHGKLPFGFSKQD